MDFNECKTIKDLNRRFEQIRPLARRRAEVLEIERAYAIRYEELIKVELSN